MAKPLDSELQSQGDQYADYDCNAAVLLCDYHLATLQVLKSQLGDVTQDGLFGHQKAVRKQTPQHIVC